MTDFGGSNGIQSRFKQCQRRETLLSEIYCEVLDQCCMDISVIYMYIKGQPRRQ